MQTIFGQVYRSKNFTPEDGLPGTEINDIKQDSLGRIWISSRNGIGLFDGIEWRVYDAENGLANNSIARIAIDRKGTVWALGNLSNPHVSYFKNNNWRLASKLTGGWPRPSWISGFEILQDGNVDVPVVAIHGEGLLYLKGKHWVKLNVKNGLIDNRINSIVKRNNELYLCTDKGIQIFKNFKLKKLKEYRGFNVLKITLDEKTGKPLWLLTQKALYKIKANKIRLVEDSFNISGENHRFFDLSKEYFGLILFGDSKSLFAYDSRKHELINLTQKFTKPINGAYRILIDREKNIWIAYYYGVAKINSLAFRSFGNLPANCINVSSISQLDSNKVLITTKNKFVVCNYKTNKFKTYLVKELENNIVIDTYADKFGRLWFAATNKGFGTWSEKTGVKWFDKIKENFAYSVTGRGNKIFLLTSKSLFDYNLTSGKLKKIISKKQPNVFFRKAFINHRGEVVIVTHNGGVLISSNLREWRRYSSKSKPRLNDVFAYYKDPRWGEFVGTYYGLAIIKGDSLQAATLSGQRIAASVYLILKARNGDLWIGTNRGVYRWSGNSLIHYSTKMGLAGAEINRDAGLVDPQGNVWIGTDAGVSIFDYRFDKFHKTNPPKVFITYVETNQFKSHNFTRGLKLNYFDNSLIFHFKSYSQLYPFTLYYEARLIGEDEDWIILNNSGDPHIRYLNLPAGKYSFEVKAINFFGIQSKTTRIGNIVIEEPFYRSWWFVALLAAFILLIILSFSFYMVKTQREAFLQEEIENATAKLKESEEQYRQIFKENKAILLLIDFTTQKVIDANFSAVEYYGYTLEELKGKSFSDIDKSFDEIYALIKAKPMPTNYRSKHKLSNGEERSVEVFLSIIHTNQNNYIHVGVHDVTEQEKTKSDLLASEIKYQTIIENIQDGLFMLRGERIVYVNSAFLMMTGYEAKEVLGRNYTEIVAPEDRAILIERHRRRERGESVPSEYVFRLLHKNGGRIITNLHVGTFQLEGITYFVGTLKDITENYKAQQALKESEERYKSLFENNTVGIYRTTPDGKIILVNQALVNMLGFKSKEELININLESESIPIVFNRKDFIEKIEKEGVVKGYETKLRRKDGKEIFIRESAKAFKDANGRTLYYEGVIEDITQTKIAFEELSKSQNRFRSILRSMPDPIIEISPTGIVLNIVNSENLDEALKKKINIGSKLESAFNNKWKEQIREAIRSAFFTKNYQSLKIKEELRGESRYFELRILKVDASTLLTIVRDVTDTVKYEKALIEAKEAAEKSDRLKSEFLAQMSHEIRTPLNAIMSFTQLLEEDFYDKISEDQRIIFDSIKRGSNRLINTIELLIHTAEVQVGAYEPNYEEVDLNIQILKDITEELMAIAKRKNLKLEYICESKDPTVRGDKFSLSQIFINLIGNAIKYTNKGTVTVRIYDDGHNQIVVDIVDTGIGIAEEFLPRLFDPFSQEEAGYTRKFEGTGLGLSLVKQYVEINNGEISVKSKKGVGTTFTVKFKKVLD